MCPISVFNFDKQGGFLLGVKPESDKAVAGLRLIVKAATDGRFCEKEEFDLMFTCGLPDKDGQKVYTSDIIEDPQYSPSRMEIRFYEGAFCAWWGDDKMPIDINHFYHSKGPAFKIIGNIYDNPELRVKP